MVKSSTVEPQVYDSALERAKDLAFLLWDGTAGDVSHAANASVFQALCEGDLDAMSYAQKKSLVQDVTSALTEAGGDGAAALRTTDQGYGEA
jgi:hypothetical protein